MLNIFKERRITRIASGAKAYIEQNYDSMQDWSGGKFSINTDWLESKQRTETGKKYSLRGGEETAAGATQQKRADICSEQEIAHLLRTCSETGDVKRLMEALGKKMGPTFVERLIQFIDRKGVRDSQVYKAAQVDKRLFSKIISNREYKPSKDTVIALALALELSIEEAKDLLECAGYTFSRGSKRDVIIEYLIREKVFSLMDVNDVLYRLDQKIIGRA